MTQPRLNIVVEGAADARIVAALLGKDLASQTRFYAAQGKASLATLARNISFHEGGPVLVVMDADTTNRRLIEEQQAMLRVAVGSVTAGAMNGGTFRNGWLERQFKVFAFIPEIEVLFFEAPQVLERWLNQRIPEELMEEALLVPKATLDRLVRQLAPGKKPEDLYAVLANPQAAEELACGKQASALTETVRGMVASVANDLQFNQHA